MESLSRLFTPLDPTSSLEVATKQYVDSAVDGIQLPFGSDALTASYNITATNVWEDTGLSITLPATGGYLLFAVLPAAVNANTANGVLYGRFSADGSGIASTETLLVKVGTANTRADATTTLMSLYAGTGGELIEVQALRASGLGLTYSLSSIIYASGFNIPRMGLIRIA